MVLGGGAYNTTANTYLDGEYWSMTPSSYDAFPYAKVWVMDDDTLTDLNLLQYME